MGHPPAEVWGYTPKQLNGFLGFASKRMKREAAHQLSLGAMASRGDPKELKKILKDAEKE